MQHLHANCISVRSKGVLILGASGAGKSQLSLSMILNSKWWRPVRLVGDDQIEIVKQDGDLLARAPEKLKGKVERFGMGIQLLPYKSNIKLGLVVKLLPSKELERMPETSDIGWCHQEVNLPLLLLPEHPVDATSTIFEYLKQPFVFLRD